ncbi:hypothetical protein KY289_013884 [Solanum tuberosum]|nr:hypothetical protein KY289_013884 [Solanum tuberosum]
MLEARDLIDQHIWWEAKCGHSSIWYDNWSQLGALHYIVPLDSARNVQLDEVKQCFLNGEWNYDLLQTSFGDDISRHVIQLLRSSEDEQQWDKPWWMLKTSGKIHCRFCMGFSKGEARSLFKI